MSKPPEPAPPADGASLADEIEASNGLILMTTQGTTSQLGIKKTAMVIAALRFPSPAVAAEPDFETAALALGFRKRQNGKWWHPNQQHFVKSHDTAGEIFDFYFEKCWGEGKAEPVAWLCEDLIMPAKSAILNRDLMIARSRSPEAWKITPLYAAPPVSGNRVAID